MRKLILTIAAIALAATGATAQLTFKAGSVQPMNGCSLELGAEVSIITQ